MAATLTPLTPSPLRALVTAGGAVCLCAVGVLLARWGLPTPGEGGSSSLDEVVQSLMVWTAVVMCGWLGVGSAVAVGATLPGALGATFAHLARWLTPRLLRQGIALALGTAVATVALPVSSATGAGVPRERSSLWSGATGARATHGTDEPATATVAAAAAANAPDRALVPKPAAPAPSIGGGQGPRAAPDPQWRPSAPVPLVDPSDSALLAPMPRASAAADATVTVLRGDTLWHLAARHLGPGASDAEIAQEWPRWYTANRDVIGSNPDRLIPGQQLRLPPAGAR